MISPPAGVPKLDPREEHFCVPCPQESLSLFLRYECFLNGGGETPAASR